MPVDVPRIRYEVLTRTVRTGNGAPVADAGSDQVGVEADTILLDGSGSFDPDEDPLMFAWEQIVTYTLTARNDMGETMAVASVTVNQ